MYGYAKILIKKKKRKENVIGTPFLYHYNLINCYFYIYNFSLFRHD